MSKVLKIGAIVESRKIQPNYSNILTDKGWVIIGQLKITDKIYGKDGELHSILKVLHQGLKDVYEITFSDDSKIRCGDEYLWKYQSQQDKFYGNFRNKQLKDILKYPLFKNTNRGDKNWQIFMPLTLPINYKEIKVELNPYVLGALLGDGGFTADTISFTNAENDVVNKVQLLLGDRYELRHNTLIGYNIRDNKLNKRHSVKGVLLHGLKIILQKYNLLGKLSSAKSIPQDYLFNSIENRVKLLQGLIDTDGEVYNNNIIYSTTSKQLSLDIKFLIQSLGGTCKISNRQTYFTYNNIKKKGLPSYRLFIKMPENIRIFSSKKHCEGYKKGNTNPIRSVRDIKYIGKEECTSIYIDSLSHSYITNEFIAS